MEFLSISVPFCSLLLVLSSSAAVVDLVAGAGEIHLLSPTGGGRPRIPPSSAADMSNFPGGAFESSIPTADRDQTVVAVVAVAFGAVSLMGFIGAVIARCLWEVPSTSIAGTSATGAGGSSGDNDTGKGGPAGEGGNNPHIGGDDYDEEYGEIDDDDEDEDDCDDEDEDEDEDDVLDDDCYDIEMDEIKRRPSTASHRHVKRNLLSKNNQNINNNDHGRVVDDDGAPTGVFYLTNSTMALHPHILYANETRNEEEFNNLLSDESQTITAIARDGVLQTAGDGDTGETGRTSDNKNTIPA